MYYYDASVDQTVFQGADRNGNTLQNASKESSLVLVNGVVLDNDQYTLTEVTLTLDDGCETDTDIVSIVVFREPKEAEGDGSGQITTVNVLTIPPDEKVARPVDQPESLELVTTQFDANWFLNDRIDEVEKKVDSGDASTLTDANAYTDAAVGNITHPDPPELASYETIVKSEADDASTLVAAKSYTDQELVPYETKQKSAADDAATLTSAKGYTCLLYTSPSPRDRQKSRMPSSA